MFHDWCNSKRIINQNYTRTNYKHRLTIYGKGTTFCTFKIFYDEICERFIKGQWFSLKNNIIDIFKWH